MTSPIQDYLERLHRELAGITDGQVATYIPELAKADPAGFGIAIATVDGRVYEVGSTHMPFTIQSISKPLVYGVALEDRGVDHVRRTVGVEPSGDAFNSISLEPETGRPMNPMINAGAIATSSLVAGATREQRLARVLAAMSAYAGRALGIDEAVFESERATGHRNRAIGHMLRNYDIVTEDPEEALDLYFRQCSVLIDCRDLALMAATLANGGTNPVTGASAVRSEFVGPILSVMATCGVYDFTGEWVYRVGLPAKSGVGGGIMAVLPGQLGIAVYSPALDERGNSVRGVKACETISRDLGLHFLQPPRASVSTVRASYTLAELRSKRRRSAAENSLLAEHGAAARVFELQGDLRFATIEPVLHAIVDDPRPLQFAVLDFKRVSHVDGAATRMLAALIGRCAGRGQHVVLTRVRRGELLAALDTEIDPRNARALSFQPQLDLGLEWCERALLAQHGGTHASSAIDRLADHRLCEGAAPEDVAFLETLVSRVQSEPGALLVRRGDPADAIYFLMRGEVSVVVDLPGGGQKRLSTLSAGMSFGEMALLAGGQRSASARADTPVDCCTLDREAFARLETERPALALRLLRNLLQGTLQTAVQLTGEVAALEG
ncbi:glutaminase A [Rhizobacter sp. AJA081-3]|uniref:glutaminase A n=1 Tax=Rhizobacter sp. AJA081-3 TaxID=2753607 RepID=UPI001ADF65F7|nr:glutaminase A [Rhizobacter sp. AJA081-3]QTN24744.1 glutaminase A [Rhizobacter sp. AJA081-3]